MSNQERNPVGGKVGLPAGTKIGKYVVRERLAIGGQGIVYKCHDDLLDRFVAIKQISPHLAEDGKFDKFLERFRREAQIIARVGAEQPAVVTLHELIEDERGLFIVMEHAAGPTLETVLQDNPQPVEVKATLQILWRLAAGLHAVHAAGIIHRDIKPGNIIIGEGLRAKIMDFGVAASMSGQTSMVLGTTKYMAPEMFGSGSVDQRADIYSLGFVIYEMLVGRAKFQEIFADVVSDRHAETVRWMKWHGNEKVQAPPAREVNPQVPQELSEIVERMMAKDPQKRFESMEQLGRAIRASFSPGGRAKSPGSSGRSRSRSARSSAAAGAAQSPMAHEEAEHLELASSPPPDTVPLARSMLSPRAKLLLAGVIVLGAIAVGVALAVTISRGDRQRLRQANDAYAAALDSYQQAGYDAAAMREAMEAFEAVGSNFPNTAHAARADVMALLAKGYLAVLNEQWDEAQQAARDATPQIERAARAGVDGDWIAQARVDVENFASHSRDTWVFCTSLAEVAQHLERGRHREAQQVIDDRLDRLDDVKNPRLVDQLEQLRRQTRLMEFTSGYDDLLAAASAALDTGRFDEANRRYNDARTLLNQPQARLMGEQELPRQIDRIENLRSAATLRALYAAAIARAQRESGPEALSAWQEALSARQGLNGLLDPQELTRLEAASLVASVSELQRRVQALQADEALAHARQLMDRGRYAQAVTAIEELQADNPTPQAAALLQEARAGVAFLDARREAARLERDGRIDEAIAAYQRALEMRDDPGVRDKIVQLRFDREMASADALRGEGNFEEAAAGYQRARQIRPSEAAVIDSRLALMGQQRAYQERMSAGATALNDNRWQAAIQAYRQAQEIQDNEEVRRQLSLAHYRQYLEQGQQAMRQREYASARALFRFAQEYVNTEEVRELIAEATRQMQQ